MIQLKKTIDFREKSYHVMHQDLHGLILCMRGITQRFEKQQKQLKSVTIRQNDIQAMNTNDSNYEQAILLMDKGATVKDLIETCGLSKGEAELMNRINRITFEEPVSESGLR
ncbi:MAG: DUF2802 domain-containing protein [Gammaproteobacteria bacterium]